MDIFSIFPWVLRFSWSKSLEKIEEAAFMQLSSIIVMSVLGLLLLGTPDKNKNKNKTL